MKSFFIKSVVKLLLKLYKRLLQLQRLLIEKRLDHYLSLQNSSDKNRTIHNDELVSKEIDELIVQLTLVNIKLSDL